MKELIKSWLGLKESDLKPSLWLLTLSFTIGLCISLYLISAQALFLEKYGAQMLPLAFIGSGILGIMVWGTTYLIDKSLSFRHQLRVKGLLMVISVVVLAIIENTSLVPHSIFFTFVWLRVILYLSVVLFWGLANRIFDIGSAKRIFPVIALGEGTAYMMGFFFTSFMIRLFAIPQLFFISAAFAALAFSLQELIFRKYIGPAPRAVADEQKVQNKPTRTTLTSILSDPYFNILFLLAFLPVFSRFFIDFLFLDKVKDLFQEGKSVANFLALFFGFSSIVEMVLKSSIATRIYRKYGVIVCIVIFPALLLIGIGLSLVTSMTSQSLVILFSFIAFVRLVERTVRSSFYDPTFQILYQPIAADQRMTIQNKIEGIPKTLGTLIAGFSIYLLQNSVLGADFNTLLVAFFCVLFVWLGISLLLKSQYKAKLSEAIDYFHQVKIKSKLSKQDKSQRKNLFKYLNEPYLTKEDRPETSIEQLRIILQPEVNRDLSETKPEALVEMGLNSSNHRTQVVAIYQCEENDLKDLLPLFIRQMSQPMLIPYFKDVLGGFCSRHADRIIDLIDQIRPTELAYEYLISQLLNNSKKGQIQRLIDQELSKTSFEIEFRFVGELVHSKIEFDRERYEFTIREKIEANIDGVLRLMQAHEDLTSIEQTSHIDELITTIIQIRIGHLLNLCAVLFDRTSVQVSKQIILNGDHELSMLAREILDSTIDSQTKSVLMPLINANSYPEALRTYHTQFPQKKLFLLNRIRSLLAGSKTSLPVCVKIEALNIIENQELMLIDPLISMISFPNHHVSKLASELLKRYKSEQEVADIHQRYKPGFSPQFNLDFSAFFKGISQITQVLEQKLPLGHDPEYVTLHLLESAEQVSLLPGEQLGITTFFVSSGSVSVEPAAKTIGSGGLYLSFDEPLHQIKELRITAQEPTELVIVSDRTIFDLGKQSLRV